MKEVRDDAALQEKIEEGELRAQQEAAIRNREELLMLAMECHPCRVGVAAESL